MSTQPLPRRYKKERRLGEGAMGTVWQVEDMTTGEKVALKAIKRSGALAEKSVLRFQQEFRLMTQLRHPNCCEVYDYGVLEDGNPYFTMEVVPGRTLEAGGPFDTDQVAEVIGQLALALGYVHQMGLVHRDLKSANVKVRPDGQVKLMDFGLMDYAGRGAGILTGTVGYMAPELIQGAPIDGRADLYSLGCLAYEMLTGRIPFLGASPRELLRAHVSQPPEPLRRLRPGVPATLENLVMALLAKDPSHRPQTARDVLALLGIEPPPGIGGSLLAPPMIGRVQELGKVEAAIAAVAPHLSNEPVAATRGAAPFLLMHGDPGIGKSRLAQEARSRAQLAGLADGLGRAMEGRAVPYGPLVMALRELVPTLEEVAPVVFAEHAPVLVKLLPELAVVPAPTLASPEQEKLRIQAAIATVLAELARTRPTLLLLEDWHWIDPLSVETLAYLRRLAKDLPLVILLTSRRPEDHASEWLKGLEQVPLGALNRAEMARMLTAMLGMDTPDAALVEAVSEASAGNPFFAEAYMEHLVKIRALVRVDGHWQANLALAGTVPRNAEVFLRRQLEDLPEEARTLARIGALLGHTFDLELVQAIASYANKELFEAVERLREAHVIRPETDGLFVFEHERFREALYADIVPDERIFIHGLVVAELERRLGETDPMTAPIDLVVSLAIHAIASGDTHATARHALPGGRRLLELNAIDAGRAQLEAAVEACRLLDAQQLRVALEALGDALRFVGRAEQAIAMYKQAVTLAETEWDAGLPNLLTSLSKAYGMANDFPLALETSIRSASLAKGLGQAAPLARALISSARQRFYMGDAVVAARDAELALAAAKEVQNQVLEGEAVSFLGYLRTLEGGQRVDEGIALITQGVALSAQSGDKVAANLGYNLLANALMALGRPTEALSVLERYEKQTAEVGRKEEFQVAQVCLATTLLDLGRLDESILHSRGAEPSQETGLTPFAATVKQSLEAAARVVAGELGLATDLAARCFAGAREASNPYLLALVAPRYATTQLALGAITAAEDALNAYESMGGGDAVATASVQVARVELLLARGEPAQATAFANHALVDIKARQMTLLEVRLHTALAQAALAQGDGAEARSLATTAQTIAAERLAVVLELEAIATLGEIELATGGDARPLYETLLRRAEEQRYPLLVAKARYGLAQAEPHKSSASDLVMEARRDIAALLACLTPEGASTFKTRTDVQAIQHGDFRAARRKAPVKDASPTERLPLGIKPGFM